MTTACMLSLRIIKSITCKWPSKEDFAEPLFPRKHISYSCVHVCQTRSEQIQEPPCLAGIPVYCSLACSESSGFNFRFVALSVLSCFLLLLISNAVLVCPIRSLTSLKLLDTAFLLPDPLYLC